MSNRGLMAGVVALAVGARSYFRRQAGRIATCPRRGTEAGGYTNWGDGAKTIQTAVDVGVMATRSG